MRKRSPKGYMAERTIRSMLRGIATDLRKRDVPVEVKLELLRHQERLSSELQKVAKSKRIKDRINATTQYIPEINVS